MADYGCYTWTDSDELLPYISEQLNENLDLVRLGVAPELALALRDWQVEWERHAWGDIRFSASTADAWEERGWDLARQLQAQLPNVQIKVWDYERSQFAKVPSRTAQAVYGSCMA